MLKLQFKDMPERGLWLVGERIRLGSDRSNDVVLSGSSVKDFHAEISIEPNCVVLISEPGSCFVNSLPVDGEYQLAVNDEIRLGAERLILIDPKQSITEEDYALLTPPGGVTTVAPWELLPAHANLKDRHFFIKNSTVLGRAKDCELSVPYKLLSRYHARFSIEGSTLILEDLNSANGCRVNGKPVQRAELKNGDRIAFAKLTFVVKGPATSGPEADLQAEVAGGVQAQVMDDLAGDQKAVGENTVNTTPVNSEENSAMTDEVSVSVNAMEQALDKTRSAIDRQLARSVSEATQDQVLASVARSGQPYLRRLYLGACLAVCLGVFLWQLIAISQ